MSELENLEGGFAPVDFFFSEEVDCYEVQDTKKELTKKHLLPAISEVFGEEVFAEVQMGWHQSGLFFQCQVEQNQPQAVRYPDFRMGDSIELFIDTKALTTAKTTHRFMHHFYFMPEAFEGHMKGECTRFRTEDTHPLCAEEQLGLTVTSRRNGYKAAIFISKECLVGYDPSTGGRLGFTYRINRPDGSCQHFAMNALDVRTDTMPCLWAVLKLVQEPYENLH